MQFRTEDGIFSPRWIDKGTLAMLDTVEFSDGDKVLDLGCGCGAVGILAARLIGAGNVCMSDADPLAVRYSAINAALNGVADVKIYCSDGFKDIPEKDFTLILTNPPYHTDFSIAKSFIEKGFNRLCIGGKLVMVTKRDLWYRKKLTSIFGGTRVKQVNGYFIFTAEKKGYAYANAK
jgi:16S rRNA (guanine1207-N2)-methyltransferase